MGMKLKKFIVFLLVIPFLVSSFNLAAAGQALDNLNAASVNADRSFDGAGTHSGRIPVVLKNSPKSSVWTTPDPKPVKEKTAGEKIKETLSEKKPYITAGLFCGFVGFLLFGPAGIIGGALIGIAATMYTKLI
jgi:hypothetical protein